MTEMTATQPVIDAESIRPFQIDISEQKLVDLRRRIEHTRWPDRELVDDQSQGVQLATMQRIALMKRLGYTHSSG